MIGIVATLKIKEGSGSDFEAIASKSEPDPSFIFKVATIPIIFFSLIFKLDVDFS